MNNFVEVRHIYGSCILFSWARKLCFRQKRAVLEHTVLLGRSVIILQLKVVEPTRCPANDMTSSENSREDFCIEKPACCTYHLDTCNPQWLTDLAVGGREVV
jgi:hypothetical protein